MGGAMTAAVMRPKQMVGFLEKAIERRRTVLITGAPGVGKSDIVAQASALQGCDLIVSHPVVSDPTDAKGFPWPDADRGEATFLPFGDLAKALRATRPTVWFLDDLGQASPAVQASYMQLLLTRCVNGTKLPDVVTILSATNRRTDRAGVSGMLEPVKSRFTTILELQPTIDDWIDWASRKAISPELIAYHSFKNGSALHDFKPTADMVNSASPRTWSNVSELLNWDLPQADLLPAVAGAVGDGPAAEFIGFMRVYEDLPDFDEIHSDPENAPIPSELSAQHAVLSSLAAASGEDKKIFATSLKYALRFRPEFHTMFVLDATRRNAALLETSTFVDFAMTPTGQSILEA